MYRNLHPIAMLNPILRRFWELGGEDPDWGQFGHVHGAQWKSSARELICAVVVKDIGNRTKNKDLVNSANGTIDALLDEFCGTPPRRKWPFPGPPPYVLEVVSELSLLANSLQQGGLRTELEDVANKLVSRTIEGANRAP
jgi:hypothetical protein